MVFGTILIVFPLDSLQPLATTYSILLSSSHFRILSPFTPFPVPSSFGSRLSLSIGPTPGFPNLERYQSISRYHSSFPLRTSFFVQPAPVDRSARYTVTDPIRTLHSFVLLPPCCTAGTLRLPGLNTFNIHRRTDF